MTSFSFSLGGLSKTAELLLALCLAVYGIRLVTSQATNQITEGDIVFVGDTRTSLDGGYRLAMQADCLLVLYNVGNKRAIWRSGDPQETPNLHCCFMLQTDGNGVTYNSSVFPRKALFSTGTWEAKDGEHRMEVDNSGIVFMYNGQNMRIWNATGP